MYKALYRKYRPRRFDEVAGQQHITETLRRQVISNKPSHAYLFIGTRGTGKTSCARILSRAVNCLNPTDGNPCNECPSCVGIEEGTMLDVVELDAASNNGVDDVREWRHDVIYSPATAKKRVFIVDEVHMLSKEAFNALLKILEEPPGHLIFILATTELHKVLPTIQSRCQKFLFKRLPAGEIAAQLHKIAASEGLILVPEAAALLARLADGSMRDGISLLDQCASGKTIDPEHVREILGLIAEDGILHLVNAIAGNDTIAVLDAVDRFYKAGKDMAALISELSVVLRDLLVAKLAPDSPLINSGISREELSGTAKMLPGERLLNCLEIANNTLLNLPRTGYSKSVLEICLVRMSDERLSEDLPAMLARISKLEALITAAPATASPAPASPAPVSPGSQEFPEPQEIPELPPPAPDPQPAPAYPESSGPSVSSDDIMPGILKHIDDISLRVFFNSGSKARARLADGILVISMTDEYNASLVKTSFMDPLKEAVHKALGRETVIRIETVQTGTVADKQSKLDNLLAFGDIVRVE